MEELKKGIDLFEKKQYDEAFAQFIKCKEYYLAGICKFNLDEIGQSINMFILAIKKYKDNFIYEVNTENGTAPIIVIYLKLITSLLKVNELQVSLSAMAYGLKESRHSKRDKVSQELYNSVKNYFDTFMKDNGILNDEQYKSLCDDFLIFYNRKLKYISKKFVVYTIDERLSENKILIENSEELMDEVSIDIEDKVILNITECNHINIENELTKTVVILEIKKSKYLKIVKYIYNIDNSLKYFFNEKTKKLDYEEILEDINIENKSEKEVLNLKEILNEKYNITKEVEIYNF